jgi:hypothetical protein
MLVVLIVAAASNPFCEPYKVGAENTCALEVLAGDFHTLQYWQNSFSELDFHTLQYWRNSFSELEVVVIDEEWTFVILFCGFFAKILSCWRFVQFWFSVGGR